MDIVTFIELVGEPQTLAIAGLFLAFAFGFTAERSGFCTRSAVLEIISKRKKSALPTWLVAFSSAILFVQAILYFNIIDVSETRFFATPLSLSGAIIGGSLFGIGMALARGCTSRLLVLGGAGNLRAVTTIAVMGLVSWATLQGPLVPVRDAIGGLLSTGSIGTNDLAIATKTGSNSGLIIGSAILFIALLVAFRTQLSAIKTVGALSIGGLIASGWYITYSLSTQFFEPIQAESLSFIRPSANILNYVTSLGDESYLSLDTGMFIGIIAAAFISSIIFKSFKVQKFGDEGAPAFSRYIAGGALMGFGGILSVGCTIGAGFTGGSVLAISSLIGLASMMVACGLTEILLQRKEVIAVEKSILVPAE